MSKLYIVPTPIGNLADMTYRSVSVLQNAAIILAEDTRTSGKLLKHYEISTPMQSYHMHNEHKIIEQLVAKIENGNEVALISDAGTPGISDPGFLLVRSCVEKNITVECLPGATAFVPALVQSGLPCDKFVFEGFLPQKKGRQTRLIGLTQETRTMVFYESPHRIAKTLKQFVEYFGAERKVVVARELSKLHEETVRGTVAEVYERYQSSQVKGEIVVILEGKPSEKLKNK